MVIGTFEQKTSGQVLAIPHNGNWSSWLMLAETIMQKFESFTVPVLETPDGEILADSNEIMEFLELKFPNPPMIQETPLVEV